MVKHKVINSFVYRFDAAAQCSWGQLLGDEKQTKAVPENLMLRLQMEWLSAMVPEGEVLSYDAVSDAVLSELQTVSHGAAVDMLSALGTAGSHTFFVVTDKRAGHKKRLRSVTTKSAR